MAQNTILNDEQKEQNWQSGYLWSVSLCYFFQGFYFLGTRIYVLAMMANWDVLTDKQASVLAILGLPAYLTFLPGLLSDRLPLGRWGRRKPYILLGGLIYVPAYLMLITIKEFGVAWVAAILLVLLAWFIADSTLDALIVDITPHERAGQIQGAAESSRLAGGILGTLFVTLFGSSISWTAVLVGLAIGALIQIGSALFIREIPVTREVLRVELPLKSVLWVAFNNKLVWLGLVFVLFFSTTQAVKNLLSIFLLNELGWSNSQERMQTFALIEVLGSLAGVVGAFWAGRLPYRKLTSFRFYAAFVIVFWIMSLPWLLVNRSPENLVLIILANISVSVGWGIGSVLKTALAMHVCPKSIEGFTFGLMVSVSYIGSLIVGTKTASTVVERLGSVIPAIFLLIPYGLFSLVFLYPLLRLLNQGQENSVNPVPSSRVPKEAR